MSREALEDLQQAVRLDADNADAWFQLGNLQHDATPTRCARVL
jgi:hypothetical protein